MRIKKRSNRAIRYLSIEDIKKIDDDFLTEMENVKRRLSNVKDPDIIKAFQQVLLSAYNAAIELKTLESEVDYAIKVSAIDARAAEETPWRRGWWWRLLFKPLTNRAQDIIEKRAEFNANIAYTAAEKEIENDCNKLLSENDEQQSKRKLKRQMREKLKKVIETADNADVQEAFNEPQSDVQELPQDNKQLQGQLSIDGIQLQTNARRPRPPRSCRKP